MRQHGVLFSDIWKTSGHPKVDRTPSAFDILTCKCASHHRVQLSDLPRATKHWRNDSYLFTHLHLLSSDGLSFFQSELLPGCAFPSVDYLHMTYLQYSSIHSITHRLPNFKSVSQSVIHSQVNNKFQARHHVTHDYLQDSQ